MLADSMLLIGFSLIPRLNPLIAVYVFSVFLLAGCSPFYILRAAFEEGKILWRREPIEGLLEKPDLDPQTREKLHLVLAVRDYARDSLKFRVGGSYASYSYVDRAAHIGIAGIAPADPKLERIPSIVADREDEV